MDAQELQQRGRHKIKKGLLLAVSSLLCGSIGLLISLGTRDIVLSDYLLIPLGLILAILSFLSFFSSYIDSIRLWRKTGSATVFLIVFSIVLCGMLVWLLWLLGYLPR